MIKNFPFRIGTIYCIGRNYAEHAKELKNEIPTEPVVFLKPASCVTLSGEPFHLPEQSHNVHHEVELVVGIGKTAYRVPAELAHHYIHGYAIGIDFTARDLQDKAKAKGLPWTLSKGLPQFAGLGDFVEFLSIDSAKSLLVKLLINGLQKQVGQTSQMLFSVAELIAYLSRNFRLLPGDLIYTGTPSGVGAVAAGDMIVATLESDGLILSEFRSSVHGRD